MLPPERVRGLLHGLAKRFEEQAHDPSGWGQFLDVPKRYTQVGLYGTSAGLLALALAERGHDALARDAAHRLREWWNERNAAPYSAARIVQNPRLAFMYLALRLGAPADFDDARAQIRQELLSRLLPSGLWGDYWISSARHDQTPRGFTSALILVAMVLGRDRTHPPDELLLRTAERLEQHLAARSDRPPHETAAVAAAVLATKGDGASRRTRQRFSATARLHPPGFDEQGVYFIDYEFEDHGQWKYARDYFIVPTRIILATAGLQPGAPTALRLLAESSLDNLANILDRWGGTYRPEIDARVSTVDQAWTAVLLSEALHEATHLGPLPRLWYSLVRTRRPHWFADTAFPIFATLVTIVLSTYVVSLNRQLVSGALLVDATAAAANFVVGGLYGPRYLQKIFPGRSQ